MADIAKNYKNFETVTKVERKNLQYYDIEQEPFLIYGVKKRGSLEECLDVLRSRLMKEYTNYTPIQLVEEFALCRILLKDFRFPKQGEFAYVKCSKI